VSVPEDSIRLRPRGLLLFVAGGGLAVAAIAGHDAIPLFLGLPLLLAPLAAALGVTGPVPPARLTWSSEGSRQAVEVRGRFEGIGGRLPRALTPTFFRPEPLTETVPPELKTGPEGLEFAVHWETLFPCLVTIARPGLSWRDPLGLVERTIPVEGEALRVQRFPPELSKAGRAPLRRTTPLPGEVRARQLGASGEFFGLRTFVSGDSLRQVNWSATARAGRLLANDFRVERTGDLLIVLDLRPTSLGPVIDAQLAATACAAAYGLALSFLDQKARVGVALFTEFVTAIPLGSGRRQRYRLLRTLQAARVGVTAGPPERLAVSIRRYFPAGVTTVVLSSLADDESTHILPHIRRRGFSAFVLSPSPVPLLGRPSTTRTEDDARALRLLRLVRRRNIANAWSEAPVVEWDDYWSLAPLASYFARPQGQGRGG
jgi:uncharacterized protein (DUF58 family)